MIGRRLVQSIRRLVGDWLKPALPSFLAQLHEVQRAIVVTTIIRVPVPWRSVPFPSHCIKVFLEVLILTTTCQKVFILAPYIPCRVSFHSTTSNHAGGGARGQNLVHIQKIGFLRWSFLKVHILITTCQKAFMLAPLIPYRVSFHSTASDSRVHAGVGCRGQNLVHIQKIGFLR